MIRVYIELVEFDIIKKKMVAVIRSETKATLPIKRRFLTGGESSSSESQTEKQLK